MAQVAQPTLRRQATAGKGDEINRLMSILELDLKEKNLLPPQRNATLEEVKLHTRTLTAESTVFDEQHIFTLCRHSFDGNSPTTGREGLKCLANIMLLVPRTRQMFVDKGYAPKAAERLRTDNRDDEFLTSRLLFLCTYETDLDFRDIFAKHHLAESLNANILWHAKHCSKSGSKTPPPPINAMALTETLKLFFNLSQFYPEQIPTLTKALPNILKLLVNAKDPSPPLQPPISSMINALINLDLEGKRSNHFTHNPLFPIIDTKCNVNRFIGILDTSIRHYSEEELEQRAIPITALVKRCYEYAPDLIKSHIRTLLLPSNSERVQPLGQADTLPGRLLRLSTSAVAPNLRETISTLLFELSDKDARRFVRNVGYGFASGFLMTHNVPIPENAMEAWSTGSESIKSNSVDSDDEGPTRREKKETKGSTSEDGEDVEEITPSSARHAINPITGQRLDMEPDDFGPEMTEDEKIREAERLFVLFERLRATGVVNVENPVTQALREGRFEELD